MDSSKEYYKLQLKDTPATYSDYSQSSIDEEVNIHILEDIKVYEYVLMFILLAISGNPFFTQKLPIIVVLLSVVPAYYILKNPRRNIAYRTFFIFLFFIGYEQIHAIMFQLDYTLTIIKISLVLLFSFSVVNILKDRFIKVLVATMFYLSIVSFVFTVLCYVPGVGKFLYNLAIQLVPLEGDVNGFITPTLVIYTFFPNYFLGNYEYVRNAGIFWEGGAFAVFLNITIYLYYSSKNIVSLNDLFDKVSIVLIIAVLTTVSTAGFVALALILTFFSLQLQSNAKYFFLVLTLISFYVAYNSLEFLGNKIDEQLAQSEKGNNRFGSALMDFKDIMKRPIMGWSRRLEVLFNNTSDMGKIHRPNGLTNFLRNFGFLYFTVYFSFVFSSFKRIGVYYNKNGVSIAMFGVMLLWVVSFSELIFDAALLKSLVFLFSVYYPAADANDIEEVS